jgi:hypothetical protein
MKIPSKPTKLRMAAEGDHMDERNRHHPQSQLLFSRLDEEASLVTVFVVRKRAWMFLVPSLSVILWQGLMELMESLFWRLLPFP